ncbi:hypothetical protein GCM10023322_39680 [Rugosimonospora acidiphila]|uniref:Uncharacterized protein n=1 Tax=Rugosimonospora acidiphila TaxID=556531 RepID=A0ABP9RYC4_9ACTN
MAGPLSIGLALDTTWVATTEAQINNRITSICGSLAGRGRPPSRVCAAEADRGAAERPPRPSGAAGTGRWLVEEMAASAELVGTRIGVQLAAIRPRRNLVWVGVAWEVNAKPLVAASRAVTPGNGRSRRGGIERYGMLAGWPIFCR